MPGHLQDDGILVRRSNQYVHVQCTDSDFKASEKRHCDNDETFLEINYYIALTMTFFHSRIGRRSSKTVFKFETAKPRELPFNTTDRHA